MQEDFQSMTYGFKLAHNVTEMRVVGMVREVEEDYNRKVRVRLYTYASEIFCGT